MTILVIHDTEEAVSVTTTKEASLTGAILAGAA
jgi:hypothetical protein